jgi:prepilin-type N-terminal cleavage/methylation domain-containing protein
MRRSQTGFSLLEVITTAAVIGLLAAAAAPAFSTLLARAQLRLAAQSISVVLNDTRQRAITAGRGTGLKFLPGAGQKWSYVLIEDGDGDGVRTDDLRDGVDVTIGRTRPLLADPGIAAIGFEEGVTDPDNGRPLPPGAKPVAFGRADICAFSPAGDGTPGTIYVTARGETAAVRCSGETGVIRGMWFDRRSRRWTR